MLKKTGVLYLAVSRAPKRLLRKSTTKSNFSLRGKFRGIYQVCHLAANFSDGQILTGGGDFAGKTFMIINHGPTGGFWAVETSPTVITN